MQVTILGSGTSHGVPQLRCDCEVCRSKDPHDRRTRASALVGIAGKNILIDCGPDFRAQMLANGSPDIDAVLITHAHYDHIGGIEDLRCYATEEHPLTIYCRPDVARALRERIPYCFGASDYPGIPHLLIREITDRPFDCEGVNVTPLDVMHGQLPIVGYMIGRLAYVTDCSTMPPATARLIAREADALVIDALRHDPHPSHMNLSQALDVINLTGVGKAYLTHLSHRIGLHRTISGSLPGHVEASFDGMVIRL